MTEERKPREDDRLIEPDCGQSQEIQPTRKDHDGELDQSRKSGYQEDQKKPA